MVEEGLSLRMALRGFSMWPFIRDQDFVTFAPLGLRTLTVGDIVASNPVSTDYMTVHRIVRRSTDGWLIRGDNCLAADGVVGKDLILARVVRVERNGRDVRLGIVFGRRLVGLLSRIGILVRATGAAAIIRRVMARGTLTIAP